MGKTYKLKTMHSTVFYTPLPISIMPLFVEP